MEVKCALRQLGIGIPPIILPLRMIGIGLMNHMIGRELRVKSVICSQRGLLLFVLCALLSYSLYTPFTAHASMSHELETAGTFSISPDSPRSGPWLDYSYTVTGFKEARYWAEVTVNANSTVGVLFRPSDQRLFGPTDWLLVNPGETRNQTYVQTVEDGGGDYDKVPYAIELKVANIENSSVIASGSYRLKLLDPGITFPAKGHRIRNEIFGTLLVLVCLGMWKRKKHN